MPSHLKPTVKIKLSDLKIYARFAHQYGRKFIAQRALEARTLVPAAPHQPVPASWSNDNLTVAWLGHATVLINFYGTWLLTDPVLRPRIGVNVAGMTFGMRRLVAPALSIAELPPLDAVLVSHAHMDHCDMATLKRLPRSLHAVVQRGNLDLVKRFRHKSELAWGETTEVNGARIEAIEVNHWGARMLTDKHRGYGGFLVTKNNRSLVFGGDTAYTAAFGRLRQRAQIDLAIMPIGAYDPYIYVHANPEQAWVMRREMDAKYILPMHHSTFQLSREPAGEPIERMLKAAGRESWRVALTELGQTWVLPEDDTADELVQTAPARARAR